MIRLFFALILLFVSGAQVGHRRVVVKSPLDYFTADNLGNIYLVQGSEIRKHLSDGKFFARYSNMRFGEITHVDAMNPLKILLYYRDFQQIVFLDNQLSVNSEPVSLEKLGYEQTTLACASFNNSFWVYNAQNNELLRFNEQSKRIAATGNLKQVLRRDVTPAYMTEHNGFLYLSSPGSGIFVFDQFGAFSRLIALTDVTRFQATEDLIYFRRDSLLCSYHHRSFEEACRPVSAHRHLTSFYYYNNRLYTGYRDSVVVTGISN